MVVEEGRETPASGEPPAPVCPRCGRRVDMATIGPQVGLCHCPACEVYACRWCWAGADGACPICAHSYAEPAVAREAAIVPAVVGAAAVATSGPDPAPVAATAPEVGVAPVGAPPPADSPLPAVVAGGATTAPTAGSASAAPGPAASQAAAAATKPGSDLASPRPRDLRAPLAAGTIVLALALLLLNIGAAFRPTGGVNGDFSGADSGATATPTSSSSDVSSGPAVSPGTSAGTSAPGPVVDASARPVGRDRTADPTAGRTPPPRAGPTPATTVKPTAPPTPPPTPRPTPRPTPAPTPTPACRTVPDLVGMKVPDAQAAWKAAGFTGPFTSLNGLGKRRIVVHQDLTPGDCMPPTTTITVTVGPAP